VGTWQSRVGQLVFAVDGHAWGRQLSGGVVYTSFGSIPCKATGCRCTSIQFDQPINRAGAQIARRQCPGGPGGPAAFVFAFKGRTPSTGASIHRLQPIFSAWRRYRAPRKIALVANRGQPWCEHQRIGTGTKRNHSQAILGRPVRRGYFSRCPIDHAPDFLPVRENRPCTDRGGGFLV
jgi:hypothetical protein